MEKKTLSDTFISINQLNRQKLNVLLKMMELEDKGQINSPEYMEYTGIFELICSIQNKNLSKITEEEKENIKEIIKELNPTAFGKMELENIFQSSNDSLILKRTLIDLDLPFMFLYRPKITGLSQFMSSFYRMMGLSTLTEDLEPVINNELINQYMVSDFENVFYTTIQNMINSDTINQEKREQLLGWKYKLIFLSADIELRALMTKFLIPDYPNLVSDITIETTGIKVQEYIDSLDNTVFGLLDSVINKNLDKELDLFNIVLLTTLTELLSDKELCNSFKISYQPETKHSIKITVDIINKILKEAQVSKVNYQKQRKYPTI